MLTIRSILHPTDFSEICGHAFRLACGLAQDYRASLHVLHVATPFEAYKEESVFTKHSEQYLAKDWERLNEFDCPGVEIRRWLEEGDPAEQILQVASSVPCDFIVMGCHGRLRFEPFAAWQRGGTSHPRGDLPGPYREDPSDHDGRREQEKRASRHRPLCDFIMPCSVVPLVIRSLVVFRSFAQELPRKAFVAAGGCRCMCETNGRKRRGQQ